ncbi:hypothetical protein B0T22DRAFT_386440 [Podospora appendiculata]|uniref:Uncharacterized protein n=1 Tax=Podospora appendiculata TaxID=314037 RepID=A0AAE0X099_9PEZI|nr:hypothetical protein B0T22DRAFT_386440 [Podospora appendiculata]
MDFGYFWVLLAFIAFRVHADCTSYGVDYSNGGSYNIDSTSNQYFSFATIFQGCTQETINPILVGPDGSEYACSSIKTQPAGAAVTSTCGIPYSVMASGTWKIIVAGQQIATQRTIKLTVGAPKTVWITATPTVVIGVTTTAKPLTVVSTASKTQTLILVPETITTVCNGGTRTVTNYPQGPTVIVSSTILRTVTDGQVTSLYTTTVLATAECHYPTGGTLCDFYLSRSPLENKWKPPPRTRSYTEIVAVGKAVQDNAITKREVAAVAAVTSTYTETTYTVTSTIRTTIPAKTTTEFIFKTVTATITPAPSTQCISGANAAVTVTINKGSPTPVTETNIAYDTTHLSATIYVGCVVYIFFPFFPALNHQPLSVPSTAQTQLSFLNGTHLELD